MRMNSLKGNRGGIVTKLIVVLAAMALVFAVVWVVFLPSIVAKAITSRTGFGVKIENLSVNPFTARFSTKSFVITNPEGFPLSDFVEIQEVTGDIELFSVFSDKLIVEEAVLDISKVALVKNAAGERNGVLFQERLLGPESGEATAVEDKSAVKPTSEEKSKEFLIKKLRVRIGKVVVADGLGANNKQREFALNFDQSFENVTSPKDVVKPVLVSLLQNGAAIADYAGKLGKEALESLKGTGQTLKGLFQSIGDKIKGK